jgi:excisionase family DNA binding protein
MAESAITIALRDALPSEQLLLPEEAGQVLRCTRRKVCSLMRDGALPGVRVGASWRVPREALIEYVANQTNS